jgi:hypothetical protein
MYRKILTDKLKFPTTMSEDAKTLLDGLLQRDIEERLKDPAKIKQHPFFKTINWEDIYAKKSKASFVPNVVRV